MGVIGTGLTSRDILGIAQRPVDTILGGLRRGFAGRSAREDEQRRLAQQREDEERRREEAKVDARQLKREALADTLEQGGFYVPRADATDEETKAGIAEATAQLGTFNRERREFNRGSAVVARAENVATTKSDRAIETAKVLSENQIEAAKVAREARATEVDDNITAQYYITLASLFNVILEDPNNPSKEERQQIDVEADLAATRRQQERVNVVMAAKALAGAQKQIAHINGMSELDIIEQAFLPRAFSSTPKGFRAGDNLFKYHAALKKQGILDDFDLEDLTADEFTADQWLSVTGRDRESIKTVRGNLSFEFMLQMKSLGDLLESGGLENFSESDMDALLNAKLAEVKDRFDAPTEQGAQSSPPVIPIEEAGNVIQLPGATAPFPSGNSNQTSFLNSSGISPGRTGIVTGARGLRRDIAALRDRLIAEIQSLPDGPGRNQKLSELKSENDRVEMGLDEQFFIDLFNRAR